MRKVSLTRQQRELLQILSKGPKQKAELRHLSSALTDLLSKGAIWYSAELGEVQLTERGKTALESGYL